MPTRIVVADQSEARFYDLEEHDAPLRAVRTLTDPKAHLHDRDFKSDRPGRVFDHAPAAGQRRGAVAHHGTGGERSPRKHEARLFASQIAGELEAAARDGQFDRLVVIAGPAFLGLLRAALPAGLKTTVVAEVPKDLIHEPESAIRSHLPREILKGSGRNRKNP
jgi:protein required for attachment to host cells